MIQKAMFWYVVSLIAFYYITIVEDLFMFATALSFYYSW